MLNLLHETTMTKVESNDSRALEKLKDLRRIAFDVQTGPQQRSSQEYWKKLGFRDHINPIMDFQETPPGMLALELMYRFASKHPENYTRFAVFAGWADNHDFPFARTSIELVKILCEVVNIGHDPASSSSSAQFHPMFFAHENPLDEMFAVVIKHVNKTWREMRATTADFDKVMEVAKEQVGETMTKLSMTIFVTITGITFLSMFQSNESIAKIRMNSTRIQFEFNDWPCGSDAQGSAKVDAHGCVIAASKVGRSW